jgi:hypothetical protein
MQQLPNVVYNPSPIMAVTITLKKEQVTKN